MPKESRITIKALHIPGTPSVVFDSSKTTITQNVTPKWSSEAAYGKMDPIPFYQNTERVFQYKFACIENTVPGAKKLNEQVDLLQKFQYPRYSGADGFQVISSAPVFEISHVVQGAAPRGGLFGAATPSVAKTYQLYSTVSGYFGGELSIVPGHSGGAGGEIKPPINSGANLIETAFEISFAFNVLHTSAPGWQQSDWTGDSFYSIGSTVGGKSMHTSAVQKAGLDPDATVNESKNEQISVVQNQTPAGDGRGLE
jgi:hypothetical protein